MIMSAATRSQAANLEDDGEDGMHITEIFKRHRTTFSFEFFPPKTAESSQQLYANIQHLERLKPSFV